MKKGCLFLLLVLAGCWVANWQLLQGSQFSDTWWIHGLLALGVGITVSNLLGIALALRQKAAGRKSPAEWRDGELVGVSGIISSSRPIIAPFSGRQVTLVEYDVSRTQMSDGSRSTIKEYMGFMMAPTTIQSMRGAVKLVGFPMLLQFKTENFSDEAAYRRAAEHLLSVKLEPQERNPLKILSQINEVLADDDGDVQKHFGDPIDIEELKDSDAPYDPSLEIDEEEDEIENEEEGGDEESDSTLAAPTQNEELIDLMVTRLKNRGLDLNEQAIPQGVEVTAFGTYRASKQAIDIGSGIKNISHTIQLGKMDAVLSGKLFKSSLAFLFWGGVTAVGYWQVLKLIGIDLVAKYITGQ